MELVIEPSFGVWLTIYPTVRMQPLLEGNLESPGVINGANLCLTSAGKKPKGALVLRVLKSGLATIALALTITSAKSQGVLLNQGESFAVPFTSLDYLSTNDIVFFAITRASIAFVPGFGLDVGESIEVDFFVDSSMQGLPFAQGGYTEQVAYSDNIRLSAPNLSWNDLDGGVRVTMLNGSVRMAGVTPQVDRIGESYARFIPVPEPRITALLALGGTAFMLKFRRHVRWPSIK